MDGLTSVILLLLFVSFSFARKSKQAESQNKHKVPEPFVKKDSLAPDPFNLFSTKEKYTPVETPIEVPFDVRDAPRLNSDRIVEEDNFWSRNDAYSFYEDQPIDSFQSLSDLKDSAQDNSRESSVSVREKRSSSVLPKLTSKTLVQAVIMHEILDGPSHRHNVKTP